MKSTLIIFLKKLPRNTMLALSLSLGVFMAFQTCAVSYAETVCGNAGQISCDEYHRIAIGAEWFDPTDITLQGCVNITSGSLPSFVPEPYNEAFTKAGNKFKVSPSLVAGLFTEENFTGIDPSKIPDRWVSFVKQHPDPNSGWPTNVFNTMGAFQFIPGTWAAFGVDGNDDGKKDPQNIFDGAAAAANYVASNGATVDKKPVDWRPAIFAYNHANWYVDAVLTYYAYYSGSPSGGAPGGTSGGPSCVTVTTAECDPTGTPDPNAAKENLALLCEAEKFDKFGYLWGGGHQDPAGWMSGFLSDGGYSQPFKRILDCSSIVSVSLYNAYGVRLTFTTDSIAADTTNFRHIPPSQAIPGDIVRHPGHMEIATSQGGKTTFGAHTANTSPEKQIGFSSGGTWTDAYVYIGKGSNRL